MLFQLTRSTTLETGGNWPPFPSTIYTIFLFFYRYLFEEERGRNAVFNIAIDSMERTRVKKKKVKERTKKDSKRLRIGRGDAETREAFVVPIAWERYTVLGGGEGEMRISGYSIRSYNC